MYCLCVNLYCHRVTTKLQLINIIIIWSIIARELQGIILKNMVAANQIQPPTTF
jgi:hypothetical protein